MSSLLGGQALLAGAYGTRIDRATAALPQTTAANIFTITTGRVLLTAIFGEVTTVIQTQANATKLQFDPTDAGATQDLCATTDITADAVGTIYSITGTPAGVLSDALNFMSADKLLARPILLKPGAIVLNCAASNTGSVKWSVTYLPLDIGAAVAAA
jgi:hypothetical protein